ncbi:MULTISPECIES: hypothetical protein [Luteimonas]|uniref:hypothetical protein n=1 Tax=Luteimonas TaxID=83614 RepID=UPI00117D6028|nr:MULTISPECIES: hypothetical protein [Luteimonas]
MDLTTISRVAMTDLADDVNRMLDEGWVLLAVKPETDPSGNALFWHSLGFPGRSPLRVLEDMKSGKESGQGGLS